MTRFARAEGSKGCNKRTVEEATPWLEMKAQSIAVKKKKKKDSSTSSNKVIKISETSPSKKLKINKDTGDNVKNIETISKKDSPMMPSSSLESNKSIKIKKSKSKRKKLQNAENEAALLNENSDEKKVTEKNKRSKIEKGMDYVLEDGKKFKVLKNGRRKPWFDLLYQENDVMTRYKNFYVKKEMVQVLDDLKKSMEDEGAEGKKIHTTMLHEERKAHNKLRVELLRDQIKTVKEETGKLEKKEKKVKKKNLNLKEKKKRGRGESEIESNLADHEHTDNTESSKEGYKNFGSNLNEKTKKQYKLEESELMTKFEDYWVLRNKVKKLKFVREAKIRRIIESRSEPNGSALLTPDEELFFRRLMKKEKRREHSILLARIDRLGYEIMEEEECNDQEGAGSEDKIKFMGFFVKKSAAVRLEELKGKLEKGGASQDEVFDAIKTERRKEERYLKNENKVSCYNCRKSGHMISDCPSEKTIGLCFTCGSTEHMARHCPEKTFGGPRFSHATCFVCGKIGHIASGCNDNPRGIFPNGGCCNECGSVRHLKANCPDLMDVNPERPIDLHARVISSSAGIEDLGEDSFENKKTVSGNKNKRIVFGD